MGASRWGGNENQLRDFTVAAERRGTSGKKARYPMNPETQPPDTQRSGCHERLASLPTIASVVALGAGTGGPPTIQQILKPLRGALPPIVIVQELEPEYQRGFVAWLDDSTELRVRLAADGDELALGHVYIAPHHGQLLLTKSFGLTIDTRPGAVGPRRRIDRFFESVAEHAGPKAVGAVLTGIGTDGAKGLLAMRVRAGTTLAQTESTSIVAGMPRAAIDLGAAPLTASPEELSNFFGSLTWIAPALTGAPRELAQSV